MDTHDDTALDSTELADLMDATPTNSHQFGDGAPFDQISRRQAQNLLGEVLYAARLPDGTVKIGWTKHLTNRLYRLGHGTELLAIHRGDYEDEQAVHGSLAASVHHGREYYVPTDDVISLVNEWRRPLGLPIWQP